MQLEQVKPNKPSFPWVVFWFCTAIILIFVFAITVISSHYRKKQTPPYTKHPISQLVLPAGSKDVAV